MIVNNLLNNIFSTPSSIKVLRELEQRNIGFTGRKIASFSKITHQSAHNVLSNLEAHKIVTREFAGNAHLFKLNRKNYIYKKIIHPIFHAERTFKHNINSSIKKTLTEYTESVILFGSVARNEETYKSDFDICVVYKKKKSTLQNIVSNLQDDLYKEYGIILSPFYITLIEFKKRVKNKKSPIVNILKEGKVISGKEIREVING